MTTQEKITNKIKELAEEVESDGYAVLSVCDHSNWDRDLWMYYRTIMESLRQKGYSVSSQTKWGVLDINITKKLDI